MDRKRVLVVFGTRPEAIKMAPVVHAARASEKLETGVCVTAQHRTMLDDVLAAFRIQPDFDLNLMRDGQDLVSLTARALEALRDAYAAFRPDLVLVHGDTTTCLAATIAAFYGRIPVGHVEAGLRTGDLSAPFPEEGNRVLVDRIASLLFPPTEHARATLLREGCPEDRITVTGNTVIDALLWMRDNVRDSSFENWSSNLGRSIEALRSNRKMVLITGHRRESFGEPFERICRAISELARAHPDAFFVYPVHLNPNVQEPVRRTLGSLDNVFLLEPLSYPLFVKLMDRSTLILTDSGGIQEEAPSLGKKTLVMRDVTERPEGVAAGVLEIVGTSTESIVGAVGRSLTKSVSLPTANPFGDGRAAERIVRAIEASEQFAT